MAKKIENHEVQVTVAEAARLTKLLPHVSHMWWGEPGIGKTFSIHEAFDDCEIVPILAGCSEPTDFLGIPFNHEGVCAKYLAPEWAYRASTIYDGEQGPMVLFFDDVVTGHEQTQAALYKVMHERRVGDLMLRDNVRIIAAGNGLDDKSAVTEMPMALGNRLMHHHIRLDQDTWLDWARKNGIHPHITAFIRTQPQHLSNFREVVEAGERTFASPRSWHTLSDALFMLEENNLINDLLYTTAAGAIGAPLASPFTAFTRVASKLVPPDVIVKDPKKPKIPSARDIDVLWATICALEHYLMLDGNEKYWKQVLIYALRISPELGLILAKQVVDVVTTKLSAEDIVKATSSNEFNKMYETWGQYLTATF